ncbi:MAG: serine/threonine protein kinase, partial [Planctomycetota bacterium]
MDIRCPHCGSGVKLANTAAGSVVECARCGRSFDPRHGETLPPGRQPELVPGLHVGDRLGGYVLERLIGKGGMGAVLEATQLSLRRRVAIKVLNAELAADPHFVERFEAEARALATLSHPNIVAVIDRGIDRGRLYLVMEYVDGVSLRELISEHKLSPREALQIVPPLCDALEYAHRRGVVHRDIKPENILITREGVPKIADFGLARLLDTSASHRITRSNVIMGSLDYMAPEQRDSTRNADHRADIYALGV